ncbi:MAG: hypothetical protein ACF8XB_09840 [Planctomycetota bacterium JB042]
MRTNHGLAGRLLVAALVSSSGDLLARTYEFPATLESGKQTRWTAQYTNFWQRISFSAGGDVVLVRREERTDPSSAWVWTEGRYSVSGRILDVASRHGGDSLYVALVDDLGKVLVEEWTFTVDDGQWIHTSTGTAGATYAGVTGVKGGGPYVDPGRADHVTPRRKVVYRGGDQVSELRALEVDPEGRMLLMYDLSFRLWELPLGTPGAAATLLHDASTGADLKLSRDVFVCDHASLGRVYVFQDQRNDAPVHPFHYTLLVDTENDGTFDSLSAVDADWLRNDMIVHASQWTMIFRAGTEN